MILPPRPQDSLETLLRGVAQRRRLAMLEGQYRDADTQLSVLESLLSKQMLLVISPWPNKSNGLPVTFIS